MPYDVGIQELVAFHKDGGQLSALEEAGGVNRIAEKLKADLERGIKSSEVAERRTTFGENRIPEKPPKSYLRYVLMALEDGTLRLLCACALLSITIALIFQREEELSWLEGVAILLTVVAVCNIQAAQDWTKERSFRKMNTASQQSSVGVIRDGQRQEISRFDIVVGDLVMIGVGDVLEADGIVIHGVDIEIDESALTGEPEDIKKNADESPFLYSGTSVKNGSGMFLATAVGINSMNGKITALIRGQKVDKETAEGDAEKTGSDGGKKEEKKDDDEEDDTSVLRSKLDAMVGRIGYFAFGSAGLATVVMLIRYVIDNHLTKDSDWDWKDDPDEILDALITGITIVVVAVPEGLPLAVTLSLSLSMKKMLNDKNMVKHLDATETMGSATTICSDKTGTLTQNRMTVVRAFTGGKEFSQSSSASGGRIECGKELQSSSLICEAFRNALAENIVSTRADGAEIDWNESTKQWDQKGNKTDCALLAFVKDLGFDHNEMRSRKRYQVPDKAGRPQFGIKMYPFSSSRKRSGQAVPTTDNLNGPCRLYVKGASEIILKLCSNEMSLNGSITAFSETRRNLILEIVEKFAAQAMRTICVAYRDFSSPPDWEKEIDAKEAARLTGLNAKAFEVETNLTFLGVMGILDPIRPGVPRAIQMCNSAGVDVRMVTGDHKATAIAIAKECGILRRNIDYRDTANEELVHACTVMTGDAFRNRVLKNGQIDRTNFDRVWPHLRVLARSSPEDKHTLVSGLCESELYLSEEGRKLRVHPDPQVVAVTGDGTNDAPALRRADVGFAMWTGTRVAHDAADILLMDDNFESVVKACKWGRNVYDSIAKFLQFQLTVNVSAVTISLVGACAVKKAPLSVVQMLWVNLIMDSLGALALANEPPTDALLDRKPYGKKKGLISYAMVWNIFGQAVYQLIVLLTLLFAGAGDACVGDCDPETFNWKKGGLLDIESGIGRGHHDPPTQHYTILFNCFVFMQLFNWINCRKLNHEFNVLSGVHNNLTFCAIWLACLIVQVLMVEMMAIGDGSGENKAFKTLALDSTQWIVCLGSGLFSMPWYLVIACGGRVMKPILMPVKEEDRALDAPPAPVEVGLRRISEDHPEDFNEKRTLVAVVHSIIWINRLSRISSQKRGGELKRSDSKNVSEISQTSSGLSRWSGTTRSRTDRAIAKEFSAQEHRLEAKKRACMLASGLNMFGRTPGYNTKEIVEM